MIANVFRQFKHHSPDLVGSRLYNEQTFYNAFIRDLACFRDEAIIESPFMTTQRINILLPHFRKAIACGARIVVNTRHPQEHDQYMRAEAERSITMLQNISVEILFTGGHHRKLAIFDRAVLWEGSLSVLSQNDSCEIMRRVESRQLACLMVRFINLEALLV
jgi:hypothetical protein